LWQHNGNVIADFEMPEASIGIAQGAKTAKAPNFKTRAGNGHAHHVVRIDERSIWARRTRELCESIVADLGGIDRLSTAQQQLVRRLAGLSIICEGIEVELAQGQRPSGESLQEYIAAINAARRVSHSIGLERVPRDITPAALESYFAQQYDAASEAAE
jgi:hypothetical protein